MKSVKKRTVLSFLGIIKAPAAHSESFILSKIPSLTNCSTSSLAVFKYACGIVHDLFKWYGLASFYQFNVIGFHVKNSQCAVKQLLKSLQES